MIAHSYLSIEVKVGGGFLLPEFPEKEKKIEKFIHVYNIFFTFCMYTCFIYYYDHDWGGFRVKERRESNKKS